MENGKGRSDFVFWCRYWVSGCFFLSLPARGHVINCKGGPAPFLSPHGAAQHTTQTLARPCLPAHQPHMEAALRRLRLAGAIGIVRPVVIRATASDHGILLGFRDEPASSGCWPVDLLAMGVSWPTRCCFCGFDIFNMFLCI